MKTKLLLMVLCVGMIAAGVFSTRTVSAHDEQKQIEVTAKRFAYERAEITVKKGAPVVLVIKSADVAHGLRFRKLNLNAKIDKGSNAELKFTPDKRGDFVSATAQFSVAPVMAR
jgi:cytochrome c oxidase subunit 2